MDGIYLESEDIEDIKMFYDSQNEIVIPWEQIKKELEENA